MKTTSEKLEAGLDLNVEELSKEMRDRLLHLEEAARAYIQDLKDTKCE